MKKRLLIITCLASLLAVAFISYHRTDIKTGLANESINFESKEGVISRFIQTTNKITDIESANENAPEVFALYTLLQEVFLYESMQSITISRQEQNLMVSYTDEIERLKEHRYYDSQILRYSLNIYNVERQHIDSNQDIDVNLTLRKKLEKISHRSFAFDKQQIYEIYILKKSIELYKLIGYYVSDDVMALFEGLLFRIRSHTISDPALRSNQIITLMILERKPMNIERRARTY